MLASEVVEFKTIRDSKLVEDATDVLFNGVLRDLEKVSDIFVRHAMPHNCRGNVKFPRIRLRMNFAAGA